MPIHEKLRNTKVHVFSSDRFPVKGTTPDGREWTVFELNPSPTVILQGECIGTYRLGDLTWL